MSNKVRDPFNFSASGFIVRCCKCHMSITKGTCESMGSYEKYFCYRCEFKERLKDEKDSAVKSNRYA